MTMAEIKQEDHTCPMVQLVPCSDVNAVDRLGGRISPQIGAVLILTALTPTRVDKTTVHSFQMSAGTQDE